MTTVKLSNRLKQAVEFIPKGAVIADIGSDHAYLPCYAYEMGYIKGAVAGEITDGPFQSALNQVKNLELNEKISVRKGDGLAVISKGEVDCVVIAGMGGALITNILEEGKHKLEGVTRLVLQPNIGARNVRKWLINNDWELKGEHILEEDGHIYEVLMAERGNPMSPYGDALEKGLLLGPFLREEKNETFIKKWIHEESHLERIIKQLEKSTLTQENLKRKGEIEQDLKSIREVL